MKFFKKGIELNNLAKYFSMVYLQLNELELKIKNAKDKESYLEDLFVLAYISRKEIIDRIEEYKWSWTTPIMMPPISKGFIQIIDIYKKTVSRIIIISSELEVEVIISDILEKGNAYKEIDKMNPVRFF